MSFKGNHEGEKWQEESKNQKIRTVRLHLMYTTQPLCTHKLIAARNDCIGSGMEQEGGRDLTSTVELFATNRFRER